MDLVLIIVSAIIFYTILYFVMKAAVRNGIIEAQDIDNTSNQNPIAGTSISQITCPNCGEKHDIDYPKCPFCNHQYE